MAVFFYRKVNFVEGMGRRRQQAMASGGPRATEVVPERCAVIERLCLLMRPAVERWIEEKQTDIQWKYPWTDVDYLVWEPDYSLADISAWPLDAICVLENEAVVYMLASLKAAAALPEVNARCNVHVDTLVTLCPADLKKPGTPKDWPAYCSRCCVSGRFRQGAFNDGFFHVFFTHSSLRERQTRPIPPGRNERRV